MERLVDQLPERLISREIELANTGFVGYGSIASAPSAATYWGRGGVGPLYYNTVASPGYPVGPCVVVRSFHNEGEDFGDWGRPATIINALAPNKAYTIELVVSPKTTGAAADYFSLSNNGYSRQMRILSYASYFGFIVGGGAGSFVAESLGILKLVCENDGTKCRITKNTSSGLWVENGAEIFPGNLFIGGLANGIVSNSECDTFKAAVKDSSGQCVACFNANSAKQWDGGATAYDSAGNPINFTDGAPTGRVAYSWVPLESAQAWGLFS